MQCHDCGAQIAAESVYELDRLVSSDCQVQDVTLALCACHACGLVQKNTSDSWRAVCDEIYGNYRIYYQSAGKEQKTRSVLSDALAPRSDHITAFLAHSAYLPERGCVIDVGCGNGAFLSAFHSRFPRWKITGAEINTTFADEIRAISRDAEFLDGDQLLAANEPYDLVTLIHCLEHIPSPTNYLVEMRRLFKPGTLLLIQVPDAERNPFDLLIADHASHFSDPALRAIVERAGFEVLSCGNCVLGKEITVLARLGIEDDRLISDDKVDAPRQKNWLGSHLDWITTLERDVRFYANERPIGIFGSSIAGTWLGHSLGTSLAFFVDEDPDRVGRNHLGVEILSPRKVPLNQRIYVALEPRLAQNICDRLKDEQGIDAVAPAQLVI